MEFTTLSKVTYASEHLRELVAFDTAKGEGEVLAFAYTDYGGDVFELAAISYFMKFYPFNIAHEDTIYNGKNAIVYNTPEHPDLVQEFREATEGYLLGFEDMEEHFLELEQLALDEGVSYFIENETDEDGEPIYADREDDVRAWMEYNGSWIMRGWDFSWDALKKHLDGE